MLGRLAAAVYNATRGRAPRALVIHTYHGHVLEGYFSPLMTRVFIGIEQLLARLSDAIVAISPAIERDLQEQFRIGRARPVPRHPAGIRPDAVCGDQRRDAGPRPARSRSRRPMPTWCAPSAA